MKDTERMIHALEDIERYAQSLANSAHVMQELADMLMDVPNADNELAIAEGYARAYKTISDELCRQTTRGLGRDTAEE